MTSPHHLGASRWTDVAAGPPPVLAVPVGSCEQHGPHLPLDTDTRLALALAERLAAAREGVVVAPPVTIGASGEHVGFPGTLSIGSDVLAALVVELVRSADWCRGVILVNGHGGNLDALRIATDVLHGEDRDVVAWWPRVDEGDAHAGRTETSLLLALDPEAVGPERPVGRTEPLTHLWQQLRKEGMASVSPTGVLGDSRGADAAEGARLLATLTADLVAAFDAWQARP